MIQDPVIQPASSSNEPLPAVPEDADDEEETEGQAAVRQQTDRNQKGTHTTHDYQWRPEWMQYFPLYFYIARNLLLIFLRCSK